ncbi:MAG: dual specificity protein phosphatase family protein [Granulosicoccus sp.]|nr:dual specificity protein phosphatase family protein [Granulosicoccus sp.]
MVFGLKKIEPNSIDTIPIPGSVGAMGLVPCPGVRVSAGTVGNRKAVLADIQEIVDWGANGFVTLFEEHEFKMNRVEDLHERMHAEGIWTMHLPIIDMHIPDQEFEDAWAAQGEQIRQALRVGERVILHCYAGLGRTGMIAARLLVEMGLTPEEAVASVRLNNKRRIQTKSQLAFVHTCYKLD